MKRIISALLATSVLNGCVLNPVDATITAPVSPAQISQSFIAQPGQGSDRPMVATQPPASRPTLTPIQQFLILFLGIQGVVTLQLWLLDAFKEP